MRKPCQAKFPGRVRKGTKMKSLGQILVVPFITWLLLTQGCALISDDMPKKSPPVGLIVTPPSYYSTLKAKYLGQKYQENLSRLIEKIVRDPKTANLQFANNIASVGGIGFFTHSATRVPDERYLEVVLIVPETFEKKGDYSAKVNRLFSLYGSELLGILSSDVDIFREPEVAGYGLNLSWRTITSEASGPSVTLERAVAYFPKAEVQRFLKKEVAENGFLRDAVIFAAEADGPMNLVSYRPQERKPDFRPPIQEEILAVGRLKPEGETTSHEAGSSRTDEKTKAKNQIEPSAVVDKKGPIEPQGPVVIQNTEEISQGLPAKEEKVEKEGSVVAVTASPTAQSPAIKPDAAPHETRINQAIAQKPNTFSGETSHPTETVSTLPTQSVDRPKQKTAATAAPASVKKSHPETAKIRPEPRATTRAENTNTEGGKQEQPDEAKKPSDMFPKQAVAAKPASDTQVVETLERPVVAEEPSRVKASTSSTDSVPAAKNAAPLQEKVAAPVTLSTPKVKPREITPPPALAAPLEAVSSVSPSIDSNLPAKREEIESPKKESVKEETPMVSSNVGMQAKTDVKTNPVSSLAPEPPVPILQTQKIERPAVERSVETKIPVTAGVKKAAPKTEPETQSGMKQTTHSPAPVTEVKRSGPERNVPSPATALATPTKQTVVRPVKQELAMLAKKPTNKPEGEQSPLRAAPKTLKGYIIQIAFPDNDSARQWAEKLETRGYTVSVTKAGSSGPIRVRIGNFPVRQEAERELQALGKDGLSGIVLNLPDGFRPTERAVTADQNIKAVPVAQ